MVLKHDFESSTQYYIHGTRGDYILVSNRMPHAGSHISIMMFIKILLSLFMHFKSYIEKKTVYTFYPNVLLVQNVDSNLLSRSRPCNEEETKPDVHSIYQP